VALAGMQEFQRIINQRLELFWAPSYRLQQDVQQRELLLFHYRLADAILNT
jgi:hypothetical protein